ncbi:MAG: hypothetical protein AB2814_11960 [Candidatus Sedimenticola endophacoides]
MRDRPAAAQRRPGLYLAKERGRNCVVEMELDPRCSVEEANARGG